MTHSWTAFLPDEAATVAAGRRLGAAVDQGGIIFLEGVLGAGKTTFCRGILAAFGHKGPVKSPTYTLVEPYQFGAAAVYHFDLYRLGDPEELEFMGIRDYFQGSLCIIEWPARGAHILPEPDLQVKLMPEGKGRRLAVQAASELGLGYLKAMHGSVQAGDP